MSPDAKRKLKIAASETTELVDRLPITREPGREPRVVLSLSTEDGQDENRIPGLKPGDRLRVMSEIAVTTDHFDRDHAVASPYSFDPLVAGVLLLAPDAKATRSAGKAIELASGRHRCSNKQHHSVIRLEGEYVVPDRGLPWEGAAHLLVVLSAAHRDADGKQILIVGQNEPDGSIGQDMARLSVVRLRGLAVEDGKQEGSNTKRAGALPLETEKRVVYSLDLGKPKAGEQFVTRLAMPTDSRHLKAPARLSTRIVLADDPDGVDESAHAGQVATFKGRVARNNGFNTMSGRDKTERKAVFRIDKDVDRPLFLNVVATAGTAGYDKQHGSGAAMKVEDGGRLEVRRFSADLLG
jgi:hypothetical protein